MKNYTENALSYKNSKHNNEMLYPRKATIDFVLKYSKSVTFLKSETLDYIKIDKN